MPLLGRAKRRIGERIGSVATAAEGAQNLLCAYLAAALLTGLLGNAVLGMWWLDPVAGLVIAFVAAPRGQKRLGEEKVAATSVDSHGMAPLFSWFSQARWVISEQ
jgi:hypothetical protein